MGDNRRWGVSGAGLRGDTPGRGHAVLNGRGSWRGEAEVKGNKSLMPETEAEAMLARS